MAILDIFVSGRPRPQGSKVAFLAGWKPGQKHRPRVTMVEQDTKGHRRRWRKAVTAAAKAAWGDAPAITCAVELEAVFIFERPRSHLTSKGALRKGVSAEATGHNLGDLSKLQRSIEDAIQDAGVIKDDCQIVRSVTSKNYGESEGAWIVLRAF